MQKRQNNRQQYFNELSFTSQKYYIPYLNQIKKIAKGMAVLEIGCGDGGNLLPFYKEGCRVTGVDLAEKRTNDAKLFFNNNNAEGLFIAADICTITNLNQRYDIILCHDVIEHIEDKEFFLRKIKTFLKDDGVVFMAFPAWQMPFGGINRYAKVNYCPIYPSYICCHQRYIVNYYGLLVKKKDALRSLWI